MRSSQIETIAVEWACIGNQQRLKPWQQITWDDKGRILSIEPIATSNKALKTLAKGKMALPGFINAHTHLELSTLAAVPIEPEQAMGDWLLTVVHASQTVTKVQLAILKGIEEALASGTTTIASTIRDFSVSLNALPEMPPIRCLWLLEWFHPSSQVSLSKIALIKEAYQTASFKLNSFSEAFINRNQLGISPHSPYNVSLQAWQALKHQLASNNSTVAWQTHLLESTEEVAYYQKKLGVDADNSLDAVHQTLLGQVFQPTLPCPDDIVASLVEFDLVQPNLSVVHGLELSVEQAERLATAKVTLVTCPRSNQFLHTKLLSEALLQCPALTIAIGTDAPVSLPNPTVLDVRLELQALKQAYPGLTWQRLLGMATLNGAKALGMEGQVGELTVGAWADITVWQLPEQHEPPNQQTLLESVLNTTEKPLQVIVGGL